MQSEASCLQQALHKQAQETQQAQQACDGWMNNATAQVVRGLNVFFVDSASTAKIPDQSLPGISITNYCMAATFSNIFLKFTGQDSQVCGHCFATE